MLGPLGQLLESKLNALVEDKEVLIEWGMPSGAHPLHSPYCRVDAIRRWAASGAEVDVRNEDGETPLMLAVSRLMVPEVTELLSLGAQANAMRHHDHRETALHYLAYSLVITGDNWQEAPTREIARLLVCAGADPAKRYSVDFVDAALTEIGAFVAATPPSPRSKP
ncbi:MAG: ankyrin repeat domain-containing protein [Gammaproteobacteria bacterium]|nr:ankyrin repeat domain-containing protein [Gammaproteobacteria bacterium]